MTVCANAYNNEADILTKVIYGEDKRNGFTKRVLLHAYGDR